MQPRYPQNGNPIDASLEFFRELDTNRPRLFPEIAQINAQRVEAYIVDLVLFARFLNLCDVTTLSAIDRKLFDLSSKTDLHSFKTLLRFMSDTLPHYNWTLDPIGSQQIPQVKPWLLGYVYERWTNNRETGSYFTPDKLADSIVLFAVYQWLQIQSDTQFGDHELLRRAMVAWRTGDIPKAKRLERIYVWLLDTLANIKIVDLSVGGAAFLVAAARLLFELTSFARLVTGQSTTPDAYSIISHIFERNIFGFDINEIAIYIAKLRLWLLGAELNVFQDLHPNGFPDLDTIAVANSLLPTPAVEGSRQISFLNEDDSSPKSLLFQPVASEGGFDICLGNPPFIALSQENHVPGKTEFIVDWNQRHPSSKVRTTSDLSNFFILRGAEVLRSNGVLTYITSRNFFDTQYGDPIRKFLTTDVELRHIFTLHEHPFVQQGLKVKANTVILSFARKPPAVPVRFYHLMDWSRPLITIAGRRIDRGELASSPNWTQILFRDKLRDSLFARCSDRLAKYAKVKMGVKTGDNTFFLLKEGSPEQRELAGSLSPSHLPRVVKNSRDIRGYVLSAGTPFRLLNLSEPVEAIELGYSSTFKSVLARYIFNSGIRYKCSNCQALAHTEHLARPELFPHTGMCGKCPDCMHQGNVCDRPVDRLSAQGHNPTWYTLNLEHPPLIAVQCIVDTEIGVFWNNSGIYATDQFQIIDSVSNADLAPILFLYLTSRISHLLLEGTAMHRARYDGSFMLKVQVKHLNDLPCPNFERLDSGSKKRLLELFQRLIDLDDETSSEAKTVRDEVDYIFLKLLGYEEGEGSTVQAQLKSALEAAILFRWEKTRHRIHAQSTL